MSEDPVPAMAGVSAGASGAGLPASPTLGGTAAVPKAKKFKPDRPPGEARWVAGIFLLPAAILLLALVFYPLIYSVVRSLFTDGAAGTVGKFTWLTNYKQIFSNNEAFRSLKNNLLWLIIVPVVLTMLGLLFAVVIERIRWATAFKLVLFVPISISFVASGVAWGLIYSDQPSRGLANALTVGIHDTFSSATSYPGEHPGPKLAVTRTSSSFTTTESFSPGTPALIPLVGLNLLHPPSGLQQAAPSAHPAGLSGVVWNNFKLGGGSTIGQISPGEKGLSGVTVQAVQAGKVVASTTTNSSGAFSFPNLTSGRYQVRLPTSDFSARYAGISWLGSNLITPAIMLTYLWIYAGFAMVLISSGLSTIPRDALEAARMDGATEWQVFRRVTAPLLAPTLMVVFVTITINVLKVFDIVYIISQDAGANGKYANVLATELYNAYSNSQYGLASAVGVFLVLLVIPFMLLNIQRFRRDQA